MSEYSRIIGVDLGDKKSHFAVMMTESEDVIEEVVQYKTLYRLCYIRGPEGLLIGLAEQLEPV